MNDALGNPVSIDTLYVVSALAKFDDGTRVTLETGRLPISVAGTALVPLSELLAEIADDGLYVLRDGSTTLTNHWAVGGWNITGIGNLGVTGELTVDSDSVLADVWAGALTLTGALATTSTVDGRDVSADGSTLDAHVGDGSIHFTVGSIDHGSIAGLADDDHSIYHTDARALTWLGTRSTTDLAEGTRLYYTDERVDDRVAALLVAGAGIAKAYDDGLGTLTLSVTAAGVDHGGLAGLADDDHSIYYNTARLSSWWSNVLNNAVTFFAGVTVSGDFHVGQDITCDGTIDGVDLAALSSAYTSHAADSSIHFTAGSLSETIDDRVAALLVEGTAIDLTYVDASNTLTIAVVPGSISHTAIANIGTNTHAQIDTHIADATKHFTVASIDHGSIAGLADDDHSIYHTDARANTWLATKSTTNLAEGTNLYHTSERVDDRVAALIQPGTLISAIYNDSLGTLTIGVLEDSIDHANIYGVGTNTHAQIDTHIADATKHFTVGSISHTAIANIGTNTHAQIDTHIADATKHFTVASIDHGSIAGLADDDHSIYHTDARALTWLGTRSTSDLVEGTRLYYTDERVDDRVAALLVAGNAIDLSYVDASNTLTIAVVNDVIDHGDLAGVAGTTYSHAAIDTHINDGTKHFTVASIDHGSIAGLADDDHSIYHTDARANTWLATKSTTNLAEGTNLYHTSERVDDRVATLLQNGGGLTWSYNDAGGTLTPAIDHGGLAGLADDDHSIYHTAARALTWLGTRSTTDLAEGTRLYYTDERVDDRVAALLVAGAGIAKAYDDGLGTLTLSVTAAGVDHGGLAGLADDDHSIYYNTARLSSWWSNIQNNAVTFYAGVTVDGDLHVGQDITVTGTVDGVDLAALSSAYTSHAADSTIHFTAASLSETIDDRVAALLQNGGGLTWSYNDAGGTLTPAVSLSPFSTTNLSEGTNKYYTDARVENFVASFLVEGTAIDYVYDDIGGTFSISVDATAIDHGALSGLGDDDHAIYARADCSRTFTGTLDLNGTLDCDSTSVTPFDFTTTYAGFAQATLYNLSPTNATMAFNIRQNASSVGDPLLRWSVGGVQWWSTGIDNGDDAWCLGPGGTISASSPLRMSTAGRLSHVGTSTSSYVDETTGCFVAPTIAGDPATPANGMIWYNSSTGKMRCRENGTSRDL